MMCKVSEFIKISLAFQAGSLAYPFTEISLIFTQVNYLHLAIVLIELSYQIKTLRGSIECFVILLKNRTNINVYNDWIELYAI